MVQFKPKPKLLVLLAVLVMAVSLMVGCSNNPLSEVNSEPQVLQRSLASGAQLSSSELYYEQVVSSVLGGTLTLLDVTMIVPPGAVDNDTLFSIEIPDLSEFYNEFGTHGLVFNAPVTVIMSYRDADMSGVDESTIRLAWFDNIDGAWKDMECEVDIVTKTVTGQLDHFSAYGLISD